jgi:putative ABC transport system ATP-binding protein
MVRRYLPFTKNKMKNSKSTKDLVISCEKLAKVYDMGETQTHALRDVSCEIKKGEFVAIMGPSGSGKSTLMHLLSLLERPSSGVYFFHNEDALQFDDAKLAYIRNQQIGFVFQSFNLLPRVSVFENVELPLLYDFYSSEKADDCKRSLLRSLCGSKKKATRVEQALKNVGMEHRIDYMPHQLSGGEKQRVAIARALVNEPELIFADEPTGNLDSKSGTQVLRILQKLHAQGHTIILVTHEKATAEHAERILRIADGVLVGDEKVANRRFANNGNLVK